MAGVVVLISSSIVRPVNTSPLGRAKIHLTPFDLTTLHIDYTQRGLLFLKPDPDFNLISRLKSPLSTALEIFFPFAGRLVKVENQKDNTVSFSIDCDGSGAGFHHAEAKSVSVSDFLEPRRSVQDFIEHFFPAKDFKSCDGVSEPLLALQVTEAERPPPPSRELSAVPATKDQVFHFTKKNISDLKAKAYGEVGSSDLKLSSLQVVTAHMWRSIIRHSGLSREGETHCEVAVDLRHRLNPPLEKECFGNMIYLSPARATVEELLDRGLGWAALRINELVRSQTNEKLKTFAEDWVRNVKILKSGLGSKMDGDTIVVASSPRFEVYNNDFGWGKPLAVRAGPGNSISGKLVLFPGIEEGSIDVQATLWPNVLVNLLDDAEFLENVTIASA
ncbi:unnamed protein product [Thlaspi arvense]|uniref:Uncharacterized protein n=1 Tax=Thlaspi arvense TaxID=13288 RepID=A0AAU9SBK9_THLAR|nr:unnamed protein product [Thlaspi arvense]